MFFQPLILVQRRRHVPFQRRNLLLQALFGLLQVLFASKVFGFGLDAFVFCALFELAELFFVVFFDFGELLFELLGRFLFFLCTERVNESVKSEAKKETIAIKPTDVALHDLLIVRNQLAHLVEFGQDRRVPGLELGTERVELFSVSSLELFHLFFVLLRRRSNGSVVRFDSKKASGIGEDPPK